MTSKNIILTTFLIVLVAIMMMTNAKATNFLPGAPLQEVSSIELTSVTPDSKQETGLRSYFRGRLWCEDGCTSDDKFSLLAGITTQALYFELQSMEITFFNEKTGETLIKLDHDAKFLQFTMNSNRFDDKSIPWLAPIAAKNYVGFRGSLKYNWITKDLPTFIDTLMITYLPSNPYVYPQNILFDQRFASMGADFSFADAFWSDKDAKEGKFSLIVDNIRVPINGLQIKLIGMKWLTDVTRGCSINGKTVYNLTLDPVKNTMTFISEEKIIAAGSDIIISCLQDMFTTQESVPFDLSHSDSQSFMELRFLEDMTSWHNADFVYPHVLTRSLFNVISPAFPQLEPQATIFGDTLVCRFRYSLFNDKGSKIPFQPNGEFFSFQVSGLDKNANDAIAHVTTATQVNPMVLQRVNKLSQNKNIYNKSPLSLTFPKDTPESAQILDELWIYAYIPLGNAQILPMGAYCRFNLFKPAPSDKDMLYSTTTNSVRYQPAFESMTLPQWTTPFNSTAVHLDLNLNKAKSKYNQVVISTSTFDFLFTGSTKTCGIVAEQSITSLNANNVAKTTVVTETIGINSVIIETFDEDRGMMVQMNALEEKVTGNDVYRVSSIGLALNSTIIAGQNVRLSCPDIFYAALPSAERNQDILQSPNTILLTALFVSEEEEITQEASSSSTLTYSHLSTIPSGSVADTPVSYGNALTTEPLKANKKGNKIALIIVGIVLGLLVCLGIGFFFFRRHQKSRRDNQEQFQLLLNEERTTLIIQ